MSLRETAAIFHWPMDEMAVLSLTERAVMA